MHLKIIILMTALLVLGSCQKAQEINNMNEINQIITTSKHKWAPDKRIAIFNVSASKSDNVITLSGETNLPAAHDELLKSLESVTTTIEDQVVVLPEPALGANTYGIVRISVANIRSKPAHSAELATQALLGTVVKIYKKTSYWYLIQTPDGYIAWVDASGIEIVDEPTADEWIESEKLLYQSDYGFAYSSPLTDSPRVSDLVAGDLVQLIEESFDYYKIGFPDGRTGFIPISEAVSFTAWLTGLEPLAENIVSDAKRFIGLPYLWGGTSTKNFDCSGFTKTIYFLNGVILQRDASQQVHTGNPVDTDNGFDNLLPGDLVFFGKAATDSTRERITHVGIFIGDTEFIHASGLVKINSLDPGRDNFNKYRYDSFIRARRVLTSLDKNGIVQIENHPAYIKQ